MLLDGVIFFVVFYSKLPFVFYNLCIFDCLMPDFNDLKTDNNYKWKPWSYHGHSLAYAAYK